MLKRLFILCTAAGLAAGAGVAAGAAFPGNGGDRAPRETGVISTSSSPNAVLHDVPVAAFRLGNGFWKQRLERNQRRAIPALLRLLETHGVVDNFRRLSGRLQAPRRGPRFTDSDLFKWIEGAAFALQSVPDDSLRNAVETVISDVLAAQGEDGYLNTYHGPDDRFSNFRENHELYCLGHLIQAAIAWLRATGDNRLLAGARRYSDYVISLFGPGKRANFSGHPEIEMALVELYRTTGAIVYLDYAEYLLNGVELEKVEEKISANDLAYSFSGLPFRSRTRLEGHAVRAMYACCGAADLILERGAPQTRLALDRLWDEMVSSKVYVTGGVGSRYRGEAFGEPYELPNERAYTETCAAIGSMMWNWRLLQLTGEARYADALERTLYNGFLSGVSLSGELYFYRNPLASPEGALRQPWYDCTCCPPNIQRTLASLPGYFFGTSRKGVWIHLYDSGLLDWRLEDGTAVNLEMSTDYPWDGEVRVEVNPETETAFCLSLRIPGWTTAAVLELNGVALESVPEPGSYYELDRVWRAGDWLTLTFDMPVRLIYANPRLRNNAAAVAVSRGPLIYCQEGVDHPDCSIFDLALAPGRGQFTLSRDKALDHAVVLDTGAFTFRPPLSERPLYSPSEFAPPRDRVPARLIPYFAWANRGLSPMQVWIAKVTD